MNDTVANPAKPGNTSAYKPHPLADIFPLMQGQDFVDLKADIKANGLRVPIVMMDGLILDGRNRFKACQEVGAAMRFEEYEGSDPTAFVLSLNLTRRHMSEGQRAAVAAKLANIKIGENQYTMSGCPNLDTHAPKVSQTDAAKMLNVGRTSVTVAAKAIKEGVPEVVQALENGDIGADRAGKIASLPKEEQPAALAEHLEKPRKARAPKEIPVAPEPKPATQPEPEPKKPPKPKPSEANLYTDDSPFAAKHALVLMYDAIDRMSVNDPNTADCLNKGIAYAQKKLNQLGEKK